MPADFPWRRIALWIAGLMIGGLALRYVLPLGLPFLAGLGIALTAERAVSKLCHRGLPRSISSVLCVGALLLLFGVGLCILLRRGFYELQALARELPDLLDSLAAPLQHLQVWLEHLVQQIPDGPGQALQRYIEALFAGVPTQLGHASVSAIGWASSLAAKLPGALLWLMTALLSGFFFSAELPTLRQHLARWFPAAVLQHGKKIAQRVKTALGGWLQAQVKLMGLTFSIVTIGLLLIGIDYAFLLGAVIALVDALPLLGSGAILLPWSVLFFLRGNTHCGFGLIAVYAAAALTRAVLEPKLLGKQMGLSPLLTLLSVYLGGQLFGLLGMILAPIAAMIVVQFRSSASCHAPPEPEAKPSYPARRHNR